MILEPSAPINRTPRCSNTSSSFSGFVSAAAECQCQWSRNATERGGPWRSGNGHAAAHKREEGEGRRRRRRLLTAELVRSRDLEQRAAVLRRPELLISELLKPFDQPRHQLASRDRVDAFVIMPLRVMPAVLCPVRLDHIADPGQRLADRHVLQHRKQRH